MNIVYTTFVHLVNIASKSSKNLSLTMLPPYNSRAVACFLTQSKDQITYLCLLSAKKTATNF